MKIFKSIFFVMLLAFGLLGCNSDSQLKEKLSKLLKENPEILIGAIEEKPAEFVEAFQKAVRQAQSVLAKKREQDEKKKLEQAFEKPLVPNIRKDELIRGTKNAPLTLIEYSDFECPFCVRALETVMSLLKKYKGKVAFIYKHLPLNFHQNANIAALYYEAIRLQSEDKAIKFHDEIFKNQRKLKNGEGFLKSLAKKVGANMTKLKKDIKDPKVQARIDEDQKEAAKFGMQGTPGFLLNGIPVKGAYPLSYFEDIIKELQKKGKVKL